MSSRNDILPGIGLLLLALGCGVLLGGCASEPRPVDTASTGDAVPVRPVLVLPSETMLELASATHRPVGLNPGRRNRNLGGAPMDSPGPGVAIIEVRDDQRIVNGRVQSQTRWRTRTGDRRGRSR